MFALTSAAQLSRSHRLSSPVLFPIALQHLKDPRVVAVLVAVRLLGHLARALCFTVSSMLPLVPSYAEPIPAILVTASCAANPRSANCSLLMLT